MKLYLTFNIEDNKKYWFNIHFLKNKEDLLIKKYILFFNHLKTFEFEVDDSFEMDELVFYGLNSGETDPDADLPQIELVSDKNIYYKLLLTPKGDTKYKFITKYSVSTQ